MSAQASLPAPAQTRKQASTWCDSVRCSIRSPLNWLPLSALQAQLTAITPGECPADTLPLLSAGLPLRPAARVPRLPRTTILKWLEQGTCAAVGSHHTCVACLAHLGAAGTDAPAAGPPRQPAECAAGRARGRQQGQGLRHSHAGSSPSGSRLQGGHIHQAREPPPLLAGQLLLCQTVTPGPCSAAPGGLACKRIWCQGELVCAASNVVLNRSTKLMHAMQPVFSLVRYSARPLAPYPLDVACAEYHGMDVPPEVNLLWGV